MCEEVGEEVGDDAVRQEKDRVAQVKHKIVRPSEDVKPAPVRSRPKPVPSPAAGKKIQIDLDAEIEKALGSEDLK